MSRHIPRHARWNRLGPTELRSGEGLIVRFFKGSWWAEVSYRLRTDPTKDWEPHTDRLGPFKRPRNAMVEAERHVNLLQNRHGDGVLFGPGSASGAT